MNLNISYVIGDLDNLENTIFKIEMCCLVSLDEFDMGYDNKVCQQGMITRTSLLLVFLLKYYVMYFGPVAFVYQMNKALENLLKKLGYTCIMYCIGYVIYKLTHSALSYFVKLGPAKTV